MQQHVYAISQACQSAGIKHAIICPGSRSAPLVFAFTKSEITCHSIVDERSAAYVALGMAQQLQQPIALICTSGTAALNFFPAIAEAFYQRVPLLILTADRPPELLNQQDGQMVMQKNVYGKHVAASYELPCYDAGKEDIQTTFSQVTKAIQESMNTKQPVHINVPLKEPLYPSKAEVAPSLSKETKPFEPVLKTIKKQEEELLTRTWKSSTKKLILLGQKPSSGAINGALMNLSTHDDVVIVCDLLSNQYEFNTATQFDYLVMCADAKTLEAMQPDFILSAGGPVLSKALKIWLQKQKPKYHFRISSNTDKVDTYKNVTQHIEGDFALSLQMLASISPTEQSTFKQFWQVANSFARKGIEQFIETKNWSELFAMSNVLKQIPDVSNVQVGNSSIIRYASYLGAINPSWVMNGNRGTSGIDGCTSTAVGAALVNNRPTYLLTGDIAFLYDYNALWNTLPSNLKIVVFNNEGGGIFQLIDGPRNHTQQLDYFTTPHHQSIEQIALQKGLEYYFCDSPNDWKKVNRFFEHNTKAALLELKFDRTQNAKSFDIFKNIKL